MNPSTQVVGIILSAVLGLAATIIGGLVLYNLKGLKSYIDKLDTRMDRLESRQHALSTHKQDCQREFVSAEAWIRSESFTRHKLDGIADAVAKLAGSMKVIEQMPQICGQIARDMLREMKGA